MIFSIIIGLIIFSYAGWSLFKGIKKSRQGKCAGCAIADSCQTNCSDRNLAIQMAELKAEKQRSI